MWIHSQIYIYIHTHVYMQHTHIHTHKYMARMSVYVHIPVLYTHIYTYTPRHTCIMDTYVHSWTCIHSHAFIPEAICQSQAQWTLSRNQCLRDSPKEPGLISIIRISPPTSSSWKPWQCCQHSQPVGGLFFLSWESSEISGSLGYTVHLLHQHCLLHQCCLLQENPCLCCGALQGFLDQWQQIW